MLHLLIFPHAVVILLQLQYLPLLKLARTRRGAATFEESRFNELTGGIKVQLSRSGVLAGCWSREITAGGIKIAGDG